MFILTRCLLLLLLRESHVLLYHAQIEPAIIFFFLRGGGTYIVELQRERLTWPQDNQEIGMYFRVLTNPRNSI